MEINITIFIQAFNFFIAYLLFKHLFFKPTIVYLQNKKMAQNNIKEGITNQQLLLEKKIEKKKDEWKKCQTYFRKNSPQEKPAQLVHIEEIKKEPEIAEVSQKEIDRFSEHMKKVIIERVQSVRK